MVAGIYHTQVWEERGKYPVSRAPLSFRTASVQDLMIYRSRDWTLSAPLQSSRLTCLLTGPVSSDCLMQAPSPRSWPPVLALYLQPSTSKLPHTLCLVTLKPEQVNACRGKPTTGRQDPLDEVFPFSLSVLSVPPFLAWFLGTGGTWLIRCNGEAAYSLPT